MKKFLIVGIILLSIIYGTELLLHTDYFFNKILKTKTRVMELDNGMTFTVRPSYHNDKLCVYLSVSNGWARLMPDENYDIHLIDYKDRDIISIKFFNRDFTAQAAYKCATIDKDLVAQGQKFKMRYPAWVEDR